MGTARLYTLRETQTNTHLALPAAWSAAVEARVRASHHRARTGRLYTYRWSAHGAWRVPLRFVAADVRACLHQWWRDGEPLLFTLDDSVAAGHAVCRIVSDDWPLPRREPPFAAQYAGVLVLESVDDRLRLGRPFVLDDPVEGRLDDPALSLV